MSDMMTGLIRPPWIELWKLQTNEDFDTAAARLFGNKPAKRPGESSKPYTMSEYQNRLGIDIRNYAGFYAEVGGTDAPVGPLTPATQRIQIKPILAIRQTQRGNYSVYGLACSEGFYNRDKTRAWVKVDLYEELFGDSFYQEVVEETERIRKAAERFENKNASAQPSQRQVQIKSLQDSLSPAEKAIVEKVLKG